MEDFWKELLEFVVDFELDSSDSENATTLYNPARDKSKENGRKSKNALITDLAVEFAGTTKAYRTKSELIQKLTDTFTANSKK